MARSKGRIEQPTGGKVDVGPEERAEFKRLRKKAGLTQIQLAEKVHVSNGTISNLESGKHPQVYKSTYAELVLVLKMGKVDDDKGSRFRRLVQKYLRLDGRGEAAVEALIDSLLTSSTTSG